MGGFRPEMSPAGEAFRCSSSFADVVPVIPAVAAVAPVENSTWSGVRARARSRIAFLVLLAFLAIAGGSCGAEMGWASALTGLMSCFCLFLVISSQLKWWLRGPFLSKMRWHMVLDAVNVWLFHYVACHEPCACGHYDEAATAATTIAAAVGQIMFWWNKLMGYTIIKAHLPMLREAFSHTRKHHIGTGCLDILFWLFLLAAIAATILFSWVSYLSYQEFRGHHPSPEGVVTVSDHSIPLVAVLLLESSIVLSSIVVGIVMTRAFFLAHSYAREATASGSPVEQKLASKAVEFSRRIRWETPFNLALVAMAFASHVLWLLYCHVLPSDDQTVALLQRMFLVIESLSLTNCARFSSLLSLAEFQSSPGSCTILGDHHGPQRHWAGTGDDEWDKKTQELALRGITLRSLLKFYGQLSETMPHFRASEHSSAEVVRQVILPMTAKDGCAAAIRLEGQARRPDRMVTHSWSNYFAHLVAAVVADAMELPSFESVIPRLEGRELEALREELLLKNKLGLAYWICCFSVNQHAGMCHTVHPSERPDPVTGLLPIACTCQHAKYTGRREPQGEMNKFDDMMRCMQALNPCCQHVIAVDTEFHLFQRTWCVAEIHEAKSLGMQQGMIIFSRENLERHKAWLHQLKVEEMQASSEEDTQYILSQIQDKDKFNAELRDFIFGTEGLIESCHRGFDFMGLLADAARKGLDRQGSWVMN
ncbi:unnamed protein product [Symbiodinium natans]|uniref:Uncharacterized protein n=1 Tax=Symbiodinium natans TaxID=878477 RepID=A0A812RT91_9DINO|nr:unnamed protein product [Symbiodinium natans]